MQAVPSKRSGCADGAEEGESVARSEVVEASSAAEPVVFDHGREEGAHPSPGSLAFTRAGGNGAVSFLRLVAVDAVRRRPARRWMGSDPSSRNKPARRARAQSPIDLDLEQKETSSPDGVCPTYQV